MLELAYKAVTMYFTILIVIRIMGKREIGKLSPFDLVVAIMIAELAVLSIESRDISTFEGVFLIMIVGGLEIAFSFLSLKSIFWRRVINGNSELLIKNGQIDYQALKKSKFNMHDLLLQLRNNDIFDISQVETAVLETTGDLTVLKKGNDEFAYPVIIDEIIVNNPEITGVTEEWIMDKIKAHELSLKEVLLATVDQSLNFNIYKKE